MTEHDMPDGSKLRVGRGVRVATIALNGRSYVAWDYEDGADPPFYHVFSIDREPDELDIGMGLFRCVVPQSPEMDARIEALCDAFEATISTAAQTVKPGWDPND